MVCFPHAGAGMLYYSKWRFAFGGGIDVRIAQYPLREQRMNTPMPGSLTALAEDLFTELSSSFRGSYAIWGHSMGSVIGYEIAKLCQDRLGNPPLVFFTSGSAAPCDSQFTGVSDLDTKDGVERVLRHYGGLSEENLADPEFMKYFAPIITTDLRLLGGYSDPHQIPLNCPIVLMQGQEDPVSVTNWQRYTQHPISHNTFDGGHFFVDERRPEMAALMESTIQLVWQRGATLS
ncbi:thioesterase [Actinophytocola xinjiangensis]|uniref:Thioesterase n=1 Tax=Actinophytocola xinjiangensis TaxID=485602 RepID=A0A7Z1AXI0_9PSEU|nr:thioesterase [Actinophytocola xinjiangensis]